MKRKEERINASVAYNEKAGKLRVIGGNDILSQEEYIIFNKNPDFIAGAEWADEHPSEANIATYLLKKGWPLSTYGIPTYEEASKTLDEYYEYKKKQWFDKACKWIENGCVFTDIDGSKIVNTEMYKTIVEDFRKEMESL